MIKYRFKGLVDNQDILKYYDENPVDCFVHVSRNEGLPVAIMEAESAGIPIISTDVGGVSELIDGNGVLLSANPDIEEIADAILKCLLCDEDQMRLMRSESARIWSDKLDAKKNACRFVDHLQERYKNIRNIIFITEGYPFYDSEKSFLETELKEMSGRFSVSIIARIPGGGFEQGFSNSGICGSVTPYKEKWGITDSVAYGLRYWFDRRVAPEKGEIFKSGNKRLIRYWESMKYYGKSVKFVNWFLKSPLLSSVRRGDTLIYSYWNMEPLLGLCLNREKLGNPGIVTRVHGYDHQDEQWPGSNRKPFMKTTDGFVDEIVFVCNKGKEYHLVKHNLQDSEKYTVSYIGSGKAGVGSYVTRRDSFRVVSCSSLISIKRVHLIIDALGIIKKSRPELNIEWVHFGNGPLMEEIKHYAEKVIGV